MKNKSLTFFTASFSNINLLNILKSNVGLFFHWYTFLFMTFKTNHFFACIHQAWLDAKIGKRRVRQRRVPKSASRICEENMRLLFQPQETVKGNQMLFPISVLQFDGGSFLVTRETDRLVCCFCRDLHCVVIMTSLRA